MVHTLRSKENETPTLLAGAQEAVSLTIRRVEYINSLRAFIVWMDNGRTYLLHLSDLPDADRSHVSQVKLARGRHCFTVKQASRNLFDVPWDAVLYHCDPTYKYFKGRMSRESERQTAERIGQRVRALRASRGMSITELARLADMQRPNLSRLESGKHVPSLETLERVAAALGVPVVEIVSGVTKALAQPVRLASPPS